MSENIEVTKFTVTLPTYKYQEFKKHCRDTDVNMNTDIMLALIEHLAYYDESGHTAVLEVTDNEAKIIQLIVQRGFNFYEIGNDPKDEKGVVWQLLKIADSEGYINLDSLLEEVRKMQDPI